MSETLADDALLDAAVEQLALTGVRRTSADDIARRAGVNRATLYRRVGTMDQIVAAAYLRETGKALARIEAATGEVPALDDDAATAFDPAAYVVRFFSATLAEVRGNALLTQLVLKDREQTLVGLTAGAGPVLELAASLVATRIRELRRHVGNDRTDDVDDVALLMARLTQSLLLTQDAAPSLASAEQRQAFVEHTVLPLVLGG